MRALTRIRTLAAALMLLLFIATTALAGVPGRPKDRPEGPGEPSPAEIGDPDMGSGLQAYFRQLLPDVSLAASHGFLAAMNPVAKTCGSCRKSPWMG